MSHAAAMRSATDRFWGALDEETCLLVDDGHVKADDVRLALGSKPATFKAIADRAGIERIRRPGRGKHQWVRLSDAQRLLGAEKNGKEVRHG